MSDVVEIRDVFAAMASGRHVVVICKSKFEAHASAKTFYEQHAVRAGCKMQGNTIYGVSRLGHGSVEFGWVETKSGRRLDDFGSAAFAINDGWNREE